MGCSVVRALLANNAKTVVNVDKLSYAGSLERLQETSQNKRYHFYQIDIADPVIHEILCKHKITHIIHMAAESHVDRSITDCQPFINNNISATAKLLDATRRYFNKLDSSQKEAFKVLHISTDEVFGPSESDAPFMPVSRYAPSSPYAASKASANLLMLAWRKTYALPTINIQCSNNYGPYQHPEKLIPQTIYNAITDRDIPIYGNGKQTRNWLYVEDFSTGLLKLLEKGRVGQSYNMAGSRETENIELVHMICSVLDELKPGTDGRSYREQIKFVTDRAGHDRRYDIDDSATLLETGWSASTSLDEALPQTVDWYLRHLDWCNQILQDPAGDGDVQTRPRE